jgi:UDP-N-acetylmuramoyl-tripeptide--D-alanyl-D-alanine ligase
MLLKLQPEQEIAVIEMGMSHAGEIASLAEIAQPETGVVTAVAPVHLQFFNSVADIARAKYELIAALPADGTAILNADDEYVSQFGRDFKGKVVRYGLRAPAEIRAENIQFRSAVGCVFDLLVDTYRERAIVPLMGSHNVSNALAAVAVALQRGLTPSEAAAALATLKPADKRGQVLQLGNITVINDCYNSNPIALHAMVDTLAGTPGKRRIVVAGEMLELGESAEQLHREAGRYIAERKIDVLLGVRGLAQAMVAAAGEAGMRAEFVASAEDAGEWLAHEAADGDVILLKASRGVKLEKALDIWSLRKPGSRAGSERSANQNA